MNKLSVLLADDHTIMREGLRLLINAQPDMVVVDEASNGRMALKKALEIRPSVVVMDLSMPELNGIQVTEKLSRVNPNIKVLVLTVHEDTSYLRQVHQAGAAGYMLKRGAANELIHAIRSIANGGIYLDPTLAGKVMSSYAHKHSAKSSKDTTKLSEREEEVMKLAARGYSNKEIAVKLNISSKTVETYKIRSTEKLKLKGRVDIIQHALHEGWLIEN